jgi:bifunctional oligoribonuclease and PAP phosphatase NrnA
LKNLLTTKNNVVIVSHQGPDGDSLGSTLAFYHYLNKLGINSTPIVPDQFPSFYDWMPGINNVLVGNLNISLVSEVFNNSDLIICLDFNHVSRVGKTLENEILKTKSPVLVIDHHTDPQHFSEHEVIDSNISSTCQLLFKFICDNGDKKLIDINIAECLYTGIITDTGSFKFSSVNAKTHDAASFLLDIGLNHSVIHDNIHGQNSLDKLHLLGHALKNIKVIESISVAYLSLSNEELLEFNYKKGDTEGLVNYCLSVEGVKTAFFLREDGDIIKISFRSKGAIKVNQFAKKYYGGGGHQNAAGAATKGDLGLVTDELVDNLFKFLD